MRPFLKDDGLEELGRVDGASDVSLAILAKLVALEA
jgi:hypothetical protein